jgi:hypothetical protein
MPIVLSGRKFQALFIFFALGSLNGAFAADNSRNPQAPVPTVTYRSVFKETSLGVEQDKVDWRKANDDVGKFTRGHVDILKQEEMDSKSKPPKPAASAPHKH